MTNSDRTWPVPKRSWAMRMRWHDLLFMHYQVDAKPIQKLLPDGLQLDLLDGKAWVGIVPFRMSDVAPRFVPAMPWLSAFPELNVRTYVTVDHKPGVWFFSLDATNPVAVRVARRFFHLKYMDAKIQEQWTDDWYCYKSHRTHKNEPPADLTVRYQPNGDPFTAREGTLEHWLTARYCLYATDRSGRILRGEIDHSPWPLQPAAAEIDKCTMLDWLGLEPVSSVPHLLFSKDISVTAWTNESI